MAPEHEHYMQMALHEAGLAQEIDEVPVGAVIIDASGHVIASAHNETIARCDPCAHAEILALRQAAGRIRNYRLLGCALYVTVEPCVMCMGAIIHARIGTVVYGTPDPKWGAGGSLYDFPRDDRFNHQPMMVAGICMNQCQRLMRDFFAQKRRS